MPAWAAPQGISEEARRRLEAKFAEVLSHAEARPSSPQHVGTNGAEFYQGLQTERLEGKWIAALLSEDAGIEARFETWKGLADFLTEHEALVEVWAYRGLDRGHPSDRRLTAAEIGALKKARHEQPTYVTATFKENDNGAIKKFRIEWGLHAAEQTAAAEAGYARYREMQLSARKALGARDERGRITPQSQWAALKAAAANDKVSIRQLPPRPVGETNLFLAVEYAVDSYGNGTNIAWVFRETEIQRHIVREPDGASAETLRLWNDRGVRKASGFRVRPGTDSLERAPSPVLGQENLELRVEDLTETDPRRWNLIEFGEPELARQSGLAQFSLINAHLERQRKTLAVKKSGLDLIAEPIIAALNIGGGFAGAGFPYGEAVRLAYNLITPKYIADVPTVKELRELFALLAAKKRDPKLENKLAHFLSADDVKILEEGARRLSDAEIDEFARGVSDSDLEAMVFLARMRRIDARVTNLLNILTSAAKVSGEAESSGLLRDIFNNSYVSLNGDFSIKNSLAAALGEKVLTPRSSVALDDLARGRGPAKAWAQYFDFSVDLRAVVNTIGRIPRRGFAEKELYKPLPYALHMGDLAAYEIRIFGFPLFIFYKRGLIKADQKAYEDDYAYGIDGAKILEHFRTREEMDAEIRAGRMVPIGYVKVPDGQGGWKDTNLAVFAHRIPSGRYRGKMVMVIYGLKAYADHSQVIERELKRLKQFERALQEGGVIEQVIESNRQLPSEQLEPQLHAGETAVEAQYAAPLANLLEGQRERRRGEWGLVERRQLTGDELMSVDRFYSSFVVRKANGDVVQMTLIPSLADVERSAQKAEQAKEIERARREGLGQQGIVFLNSAVRVDGGYEVGPLLTNEQGGVVGVGVRAKAAEFNQVFTAIEKLPLVERARLQENNYAATLLNLELERIAAPVFVTIEFPPGASTSERTNAQTGELEKVFYENGRIRSVTTARRHTEIVYGNGIETGSRTYARTPERQVIEESRTVQGWPSDQSGTNPYAPRLAKLRINYGTGEMKRETYGAFPQPISIADDQFVTANSFTLAGEYQGSVIFDNGTNEVQFQRPLSEKLFSPIVGRERFALQARRRPDGNTEVRRVDLITLLEKTMILDATGRKIAELWTEPIGPERQLATTTTIDYHDDFFYGMVPFRSRITGAASALRSEAATASYDPDARRLSAVVTDYTGRVLTNVWDYRWEAPLEMHSGLRVTTNSYNRTATRLRGATIGRMSGEELATFEGTFDVAQQRWEIRRTTFYRAGITNGAETLWLNGFGHLTETQMRHEHGTLSWAYGYDRNGVLTNVSCYAGGTPGNALRVEDDFRWNKGMRDARVRTGGATDGFRVITDAEGRTIESGIREFPGLRLSTLIRYDGESYRAVESEELQNGERRALRTPLPPVQASNQTWLLPVQVTPAWGLASTQTFLLGDALARANLTLYEDGTSARAREWFPGTSLARITEVFAPNGSLRERVELLPGAGTHDAMPYDLVRRYRLGFFGHHGLAEEQAFLAGTDVLLFSQTAGERLHYDWSKLQVSPVYAVDPRAGSARSNLVRLVKQTVSNDVVLTESTDLRGLFFHSTSQRIADRSGNVMAEQLSRIPSVGGGTSAAGEATSRKLRYAYEAGWLVEQNSAAGRAMAFTTNRSALAVNQNGRRDFMTQIEVSDGQRVLRRIHSPRVLEANPYFPARTNLWTAWTASELREDGRELFQSELIYDAQGRLALSKTVKTGPGGDPAVKIVYDIGPPLPGELSVRAITNGFVSLPLSISSQHALQTEFLYWYALSTNSRSLTWRISDGKGRTLRLTNGAPELERDTIAFWPVRSGHTLWLPDSVIPQQASVVRAPALLADSNSVFVVSTHDLARAGLEVARIKSIDAVVEGAISAEPAALAVSPVYQLRRGATSLPRRDHRTYAHEVIRHSSGLTTYVAGEQGRTIGEIHGAQRMAAVTMFNDLPVAATYTVRGKAHVFLIDHTAESPRPMYAVWPREGRFLEHYQTVRRAGSELYAIVQGFELPRVEIFNPQAIGDEVFPGTVAYGRNYEVIFRPARGRGWLGESLAALESRVVANTFKFAGQEAFDGLGWTNIGSGFAPHFEHEALQRAQNQARQIQRLPTLAAALLPTRPVPWGASKPTPMPPSNNWNTIRFALGRLHLKYPTGLIPTAPDTEVERFVDTERQADLIILAFKLGEKVVAREVLDFYWQKSHGGQAALHASYDAQAGTAMTTDLAFQRPVHARRTAGAQLAIADAAFTVGFETGENQWITLGRNLLELSLRDFRAPASRAGGPRGITDYEYLPLRRAYGFTLWPDAELYSLRNNARLAMLLKRLAQMSDRFADRRWRFAVRLALREQEAWLRANSLAELDRAGVPPKGWFSVQDIAGETTAIAPERTTSAEDWLAIIEAAHEMGIPDENSRRWLENLARVHGVQVGETWGLDWSVPTLRPDVISTDLTAAFVGVARKVGHLAAAEFALGQISRIKTGGSFPAVVTTITPERAIQSGQGSALHPRADQQQWPNTFAAYKHLRLIDRPAWNFSNAPAQITTIPVAQVWPRQRTDMTVFVLITAGVYLAILGSAIFWWSFRALRGREPAKTFPDPLVPDQVMQLAEERWALRVLGARTPANAGNSRFSNAPVEVNFLMQLRAIYKLLVEWRRQENGWAEDDRRIVEAENDDWLNGLDEYACALGLYMRWVIKAGMKDGFNKENVIEENEDSNHIWSRLVMFCSEYYWGVLTLLKNYNLLVLPDDKANLLGQMSQLLSSFGMRQRSEPFDARALFNCPEDRSAMDLLFLQQPGRTLDEVLIDASKRLRIPYLHLVRIVERYKEFKRREDPIPIHPYTIELAKILPHFLLMGLGALVWYNQRLGDSPIVPYLWSVLVQLALSPMSLFWAVPLFVSMVLGVATHFVRIYRFDAPMLVREKTELFLDATLTSLFVKRHSVMPKSKQGRWWNPVFYEWSGWGLRAVGYLGLGITLLSLDTPSFATFLVVKGILAMLAFVEVVAIAFPLAATAFSKFLQDWVTSHPGCGRLLRFINKLNITATRPASPIWLSIKYHTQPSVPTGDFRSMAQAVVFYFLLGAVFFFTGGYLCQQILSLWFMDSYLTASNWKLFFGGLLFWNTMYLLRYGLFLLFTGIASALVSFPIKTTFVLLAGLHVILIVFANPLGVGLIAYPGLTYSLMFIGLVLMVFEPTLLRGFKRFEIFRRNRAREEKDAQIALAEIKASRSATLGVVYMSGDDLSHLKLTPDLLMERWTILRDRLGSNVIQMLFGALDRPDDVALRQWFDALYAAEKRADVTLWHPLQINVSGEKPRFAVELGLTISVESSAQRAQLIAAWHVRRWLVSMMSTAGHSQDTAINLVDIALRLSAEGLAPNTVFYLVQNKYDNNDNNRPSQSIYDRGELGHRNKLARLFIELAPGARAYSLQNWTPFGFKAGGLTGMDLVHEESMKLTTMLLLDRNATVHDLDGLMADLTTALTDPDVVIIIPGRGTTNTLTSVGQGSQMVEEGHRSFLKGMMGLLGGRASEAVGTGWGNLLAVYYGRVQRALVDAHSPKMPLTSRMRRGSSFAVRAEGLIGFAPHAVGISEDTWAVSQTAHNAIALGRRVKFLVSRAIWHKIRETWSHSEWLASFPRWSGGYLQMMHDPIMQRVNDFGASSVFAKEVRANSGRNFLSAPFALFNILFMPLAIMLDITPFIQILIVLWNFGFVMNQILTVHGLNTYLESSGFYRSSALLGAAVASAFSLLKPGLQPFTPALIIAGFLLGGFFVGVSRWLYTRMRDMLLFGPQLVLHALGQVVRQTLEFTVSGASPQDARGVNMAFRTWAGPREDRPWEGYPQFINLKTVIWGVGLLSVVLNLFALANLDMLNVLLLLPSLLFSASALLGPFLLRPRLGAPIGKWTFVPRILGWISAILFYTATSMLIARERWLKWLGVVLFFAVFALLVRHGLQFLGYRRRWRRLRDQLCTMLKPLLPASAHPRPLAETLMQRAGDSAQIATALERAGIAPDHREPLLGFLERQVAPMLRAPVSERRPRWISERFASEFSRALALALFILVWFFVVPVPGVLVFTAGSYRFSMELISVVELVGWIVGVIIAGAWVGRIIQWLDRAGPGKNLKARFSDALRKLRNVCATPEQLPPAEVARACALFTDVQTYLDQRSLAYARRSLSDVESILAKADQR